MRRYIQDDGSSARICTQSRPAGASEPQFSLEPPAAAPSVRSSSEPGSLLYPTTVPWHARRRVRQQIDILGWTIRPSPFTYLRLPGKVPDRESQTQQPLWKERPAC